MRIAQWLQHHARERPDDDAIVEAGRRTSWRELNADVHARARALHQRGIGRGNRVVADLPNGREFISTMLASWLLEAIFVPLNLRWVEREKAAAIRDAAADIVVRPGTLKPEPGPVFFRPVDASAVASIFYTSGSGGEPKGVVHTHTSIEASARQFIDALQLERHDINYAAAPFYNVSGLTVCTIPLLICGGTTICARTFDPARALAELDAYRATCAFMVPRMWNRMRQHINFDDTQFSLRVAVSGGAPTPSSVIDAYRDRGVAMLRSYGMTEAAPMATLQRADRPNSSDYDCGQPGAEVELHIVDDDHEPVAPGEEGEVALRAPNLMARYWKRPADTDTKLQRGWYFTGDRGRLVDDRLEVYGRIDDMIITGGENVYPSEIEALLHKVNDIDDVAIIGVPDEEWGEIVTAVVVPSEGATVTETTIVSALVGCVARYKIPRVVEIVDELPMAPTGKTDRSALRERFSADSVSHAETS